MPKDDVETVKMTVEIPKSLHKEAKMLAIIEERTLKEIVISALKEYT